MHGPNDFRFEKVPVPEIGDGEILIRVLIGLDLREARLQKAKEFGADIVLNPRETDAIREVKELTGGYGCDVFIEAAGSESSVRQGLAMVRNLGRFV